MVLLPVGLLALLGRRDGRILSRGLLEDDRHEQQRDAAGLEHAHHLAHRQTVVRDVLEHVDADDQVEGVVLERDVGHVHVLEGLVAREIGAHVGGVRERAQAAL